MSALMSLRETRKAQTMAAILGAAGRLFAEHGYDATSTRQIAAEAGIATGTLFNYAATKEEIVLLLWAERATAASEAGLAAAAQVGEPVDAMTALFAPIFAMYAEDPDLGKVFMNQAIYADDSAMPHLYAGFVGRIAMLLAPRLGGHAPTAALNVFGAFTLCALSMLSGRVGSPAGATSLFRTLVASQAQGWPSR